MEMILDCPGGTGVITGVLKAEGGESERCRMRRLRDRRDAKKDEGGQDGGNKA